jgi:Uma2 family endonuclease
LHPDSQDKAIYMPTTALLQAAQATLRHHFSVDEYYRMAETGILPEGHAVELLEGEIYTMSPVNSLHAGMVNKLNRLLMLALPPLHYIITVQNPIRFSPTSEPEPDLAVLRYRADFYQKSHPEPKDAFLLIEVSDSSLYKDQKIKLPLYAQADIPEVWIVNIEESKVEVYQNPSGSGYLTKQVCGVDDRIVSNLLGDLAAVEILG